MHINFSEPLGTYQLENSNICNEYQIEDILIYIEFHQDKKPEEFYQQIQKNYQHDYKNIPIINRFAHKLFCEKNTKYKQIIDNINANITCLKVYSLRYYMKHNYVEYDCFINYDFLALIKDKILQDDLYTALDNAYICLKYNNGIIEEA